MKYYISGWRKDRKDGSGQFLSLAFKPVDEDGGSRPAPVQQTLSEESPF